VLVGVEVDEQVVDLVEDFLAARVVLVDLVDEDDRDQLVFECLRQHEAGLRHRALRRVDQQENAVRHGQDAFHLAAEVRVPGRVDDVDLDAAVFDDGVLREDGDAPLAFQFIGVEDAIHRLLVLPEGASLTQHAVHEGGLPVVDVGDDGDVSDPLGHSACIGSACKKGDGLSREVS